MIHSEVLAGVPEAIVTRTPGSVEVSVGRQQVAPLDGIARALVRRAPRAGLLVDVEEHRTRVVDTACSALPRCSGASPDCPQAVAEMASSNPSKAMDNLCPLDCRVDAD